MHGRIANKRMILDGAAPDIAVDAESNEVRAAGELLTCPPAEARPMAQLYVMY